MPVAFTLRLRALAPSRLVFCLPVRGKIPTPACGVKPVFPITDRGSCRGVRFRCFPDIMLTKKVRVDSQRALALSAQQTNLVRSVLRNEAHYLNHSHRLHPKTGVKTVMRLVPEELARFRSTWEKRPVGCIGSMNRAIASVREPHRAVRYLNAAFDLEILMDRSGPATTSRDLVGIPAYLKDGYTDLGFSPLRNRREKILVDKERLSRQLVTCKRRAIEELSESRVSADLLETHLRELGTTLRESVGYHEGEPGTGRSEETVLLSDCVERRAVACRHLSILMQLRLQECGISSRLTKGVLRLFGLKGRHAWNIVHHGDCVALVDVTFAEDDGPFVLAGTVLGELYQRAADSNRAYRPSPDTANHYQLRRSSSGPQH